MKPLATLAALIGLSQAAYSQVIHIEVDIRRHLNDASNITGCVLEPPTSNYKMYIHSGVCSATTPAVPDPIDCQNPLYVWEHVVGDWGMDNGHGLMTKQADSLWYIDIDVSTYYSNPNTISQTGQGGGGASTIKPIGATAYSMGFVFRNEDGTIGGITGGCTDFFIFNLHQGNTTVDVGQPGFSLPDSIFAVNNTPTGVRQADNTGISVSLQTVFPNPFNDEVKFTYHAPQFSERIDFSVYNAMGQQVRALYRGEIQAGVSTLVWDGKTDGGTPVQPGLYYVVISNGEYSKTAKIVKM